MKTRLKLRYIDHYDSFTHNVIDWLKSGDFELDIEVVAYDQMWKSRFMQAALPTILSPGPGLAFAKEPTCDFTRYWLGRVPILGICLGHQILGVAAGLKLRRSCVPLHGAAKEIQVVNRLNFFAATPTRISGAAYHSLVVAGGKIGPGWHVSLRCDKGEVQGLEYVRDQQALAVGVQFHPESFLSQDCDFIRDRWLAACSQLPR